MEVEPPRRKPGQGSDRALGWLRAEVRAKAPQSESDLETNPERRNYKAHHVMGAHSRYFYVSVSLA